METHYGHGEDTASLEEAEKDSNDSDSITIWFAGFRLQGKQFQTHLGDNGLRSPMAVGLSSLCLRKRCCFFAAVLQLGLSGKAEGSRYGLQN